MFTLLAYLNYTRSRLLRLLRRRVCQLLPQDPALGRPRVGAALFLTRFNAVSLPQLHTSEPVTGTDPNCS